jgi:DUF4097 and DUF4098 domain-containing protein YvlB
MRLLVFAALLLLTFNANAWNCKYDKQINKQLDLDSASKLLISARAGELDIKGSDSVRHAEIKARACASDKEWLEQMDVELVEGENSEINVVVPDYDSLDTGWGDNYVYIDLEITVPSDMALDVKDSSGDLTIDHVGTLELQDSSGAMEVTDVKGAVTIFDSSGEIELHGVEGDVSIQDSSGDMRVVDVFGDMTVISDSSGDIDARDIEGTVRIVADSSGGIDIRDVSKDVIVERDSSGDITVENIDGNFEVQRDGSGSINSRKVAGKVTVPNGKG